MKNPDSKDTIPPAIEEAFDLDRFRSEAIAMIDTLVDHLQSCRDAVPTAENRAIDWLEPSESTTLWDQDFPTLDSLARHTLQQCVRLHHPGFLGHQISPVAPAASLVSMLADLVNNGMGVYEMGIAGTTAEHEVVQLTAKAFGMPESAGGFMTSGGSLANLTALLCARQNKSNQDTWQNGNREKRFAAFVAGSSHYCMERAVKIMGWGQDGLIRVPVDQDFRMCVDTLPKLYSEAKQDGLTPIAVVGNACSTSTGSFDDLAAIADFCKQYDLWFHVDGAHGAAVAFSPTHRNRLAGIERADSVTIDFHKMLLVPALASGLIFRIGSNAFRTFAQKAEYLLVDHDVEASPDLALRTFECTKQMMGLKVLALWKLYGRDLFEANVDRLFELTKTFSNLIKEREHFELAIEPQCNILCYRYRPPGMESAKVSRLNESIRQKLLEEGAFYIVQTRLPTGPDGQIETWLRTTLSNGFCNHRTLDSLLNRIERIGCEISASTN